MKRSEDMTNYMRIITLKFKINAFNTKWAMDNCNKNFTLSYPYNDRESIIFGSNFRNGDFDGFTRYKDT